MEKLRKILENLGSSISSGIKFNLQKDEFIKEIESLKQNPPKILGLKNSMMR